MGLISLPKDSDSIIKRKGASSARSPFGYCYQASSSSCRFRPLSGEFVQDQPLFHLGDHFFGELHRIRVHGHAVDATLHQEGSEVRVHAGSLTAERNGLTIPVGHFDQVTDGPAYSQVPFVEQMGNAIVVPVAAQDQHGQVVGTDGIPIHELVELISQDDVGRNFRHEPYLEVRSSVQPFLGHDFHHFPGFVHGAAEGDHHVQVLQAVFLPYFPYGFAFQPESFRVFGVVVPGSASPAQQITGFCEVRTLPRPSGPDIP